MVHIDPHALAKGLEGHRVPQPTEGGLGDHPLGPQVDLIQRRQQVQERAFDVARPQGTPGGGFLLCAKKCELKPPPQPEK